LRVDAVAPAWGYANRTRIRIPAGTRPAPDGIIAIAAGRPPLPGFAEQWDSDRLGEWPYSQVRKGSPALWAIAAGSAQSLGSSRMDRARAGAIESDRAARARLWKQRRGDRAALESLSGAEEPDGNRDGLGEVNFRGQTHAPAGLLQRSGRLAERWRSRPASTTAWP